MCWWRWRWRQDEPLRLPSKKLLCRMETWGDAGLARCMPYPRLRPLHVIDDGVDIQHLDAIFTALKPSIHRPQGNVAEGVILSRSVTARRQRPAASPRGRLDRTIPAYSLPERGPAQEAHHSLYIYQTARQRTSRL